MALCRALLDGTREDVLMADEEGRITYVSAGLAELAGSAQADLVSEPADRVLGALGLPGFEELHRMLTTVSWARTEATLVETDGTEHPIWLRGVRAATEDSGMRYIWLLTPLHRLRSVQQARRIVESELETQSRLLALVSHELRTPLNTLLSQLSLMDGGLRGELTGEQKDSVSRCLKASRNLLALINDLIDFARLETDELELEVRTFRIEPVLGEVVDTVRELLGDSELDLELRLLGRPVHVRADPSRTRQILLQLLSNAVKFSERGTILVESHPVEEPRSEPFPGPDGEGSFLAVKVRDPGIGIPPEELDRIFGPFEQVAALLSRPTEGTGLGLAIARRLARRQGGELLARSSANGGSLFSLYLPVAAAN